MTLFYSRGLMLMFYFLPEALTGIPIEPQREKRRRRRKEGIMTVIITQSCHTGEVRKTKRATSQNITRKKVNMTMDIIQRNIGIQTGKTTERTIYYHPTAPHNQMEQPIIISMDTWVKHVIIFKLIFSHYQNATITACSLKCHL